jgi:GNAT superfamily N-acetyltransferase
MPDIALRRALETDIPALQYLMQASTAYHGQYAAMVQGYAIAPAQVARDHMVLAERGGEVLGFYSLITGPEPELDLMFVSDGAQGLGLGARLFAHMAGVAREAGMAAVKIVSNPPALGFYERQGAVVVGRREPAGRITWSQPILNFTP